MALLLGENVNIGIGIESFAARGTGVSPTHWIGGRAPATIRSMVETAVIRETRAGKIASAGEEVVQKRAEGELEFNVRANTLGPILLALLGNDTVSTVESGVYSHLFEVLPTTPQLPTLTLALAQAGSFQDYEYPMAAITNLELRAPVDDLVNATAGFVAKSEATHAAYTPAFASTDYVFRPQDVTFKLASNLAGLGAASAIKLKELTLAINSNARVNQNIGEINPSDVLSLALDITGSIRLDYQNETYHDLVLNNTTRAMRIEFNRSDTTIGAASTPKLTIDLAAVTFGQYNPDRPIDDIVTEELPFRAHYSNTDAKAITATLVNTTATYEVA